MTPVASHSKLRKVKKSKKKNPQIVNSTQENAPDEHATIQITEVAPHEIAEPPQGDTLVTKTKTKKKKPTRSQIE